MLKLVVRIIILVAICCAQEHLTCLKTDDVLNQQNPRTPQRAVQGPPGKRGAKGQVGSRGSPGQKGEPGITDSQQIDLLRDQFDSLSRKMEVLKNQTKENRQLIEDALGLKQVLYIAPHLYVYKTTPNSQSWQESQEYCQSWGGTLAVYGVKTLQNRKRLIENLSINVEFFWIGASDIASEGNWIWVNGERVNSSELIWRSGQPNNVGGNEDCLRVYGFPTSADVALAYDGLCSTSHLGLCETRV